VILTILITSLLLTGVAAAGTVPGGVGS
jgi:hypothetical protein